MAESVDSVVLQLEARLGDYNAQVAGAANNTERSLGRVQSAAVHTEKVLGTSFNNARISQQILQRVGRGVADQYAASGLSVQLFTTHLGELAEAGAYAGGTFGRFGAFLAGPWGIALTLAATVILPLIANLFKADEAAKQVKFATDGMSDAQGILGRVMDTTTGKINTQSQALLALARAQIIAGQVKARSDIVDAQGELSGLRKPTYSQGATTMAGGAGLYGAGFQYQQNANPAGAVIAQFQSGKMQEDAAVAALADLAKKNSIDSKTLLAASKAVTDFGTAQANLGYFTDAEKLLNGTGGKGLLKTPSGGAGGRAGKRAGAGRGGGSSASSGPSADDIDKRFTDQLASLTEQTLSAREQTATSAEDEAELQLRAVEWARLKNEESIKDAKDLSDDQRARLTVEAESLAFAQRAAVERQKQVRLEQEASQLADESHQASADALQQQYDLAKTDADRRRVALQILDADDAYLQSKLQSVIDSKTASDAERQRAKIALDALNATAGARRDLVNLQNEGPLARYADSLSDPASRVQQAVADKLQAVNKGITDALAKDLGIKDEFVKNLFSIFLDNVIFRPLAEALSKQRVGGGGGGLGGIVAGIVGLFGGGGGFGGGGFSGGFGAGMGSGISLGSTPGFASGGSMRLGARSGTDQNMLSLNGSPLLRVSAGEILNVGNPRLMAPGAQSGGVSVVRIELTEDLDGRIQSVSGPVAVKIVRAAQPALTQAAVNETFRQGGRPKL